MGIEDGFCDAAALEQGEAQQHGISDARPERRTHIAVHADVLHQHRVNADADHDARLKTGYMIAGNFVTFKISKVINIISNCVDKRTLEEVYVYISRMEAAI